MNLQSVQRQPRKKTCPTATPTTPALATATPKTPALATATPTTPALATPTLTTPALATPTLTTLTLEPIHPRPSSLPVVTVTQSVSHLPQSSPGKTHYQVPHR